jgi:hypothetical protein
MLQFSERPTLSTPKTSEATRIIHVISPYTGEGSLARRQEMFLESIARAHSDGVTRIGASNEIWHCPGWETRTLARTATILGDPSDKPFLRDLFDLAFEYSHPNDWLLYSNVDCAFAADLYRDLAGRRATVAEYQRQDVAGDPKTLDELFSKPRTLYSIGLDAIAIRASLFQEIREFLPDFVVGEPHWDTIYSGLFRRVLPVQRDNVRLFHPKHQQVWDLSHPTPAGLHNHELFVESLNRGLAEKSLLVSAPDRTDTAIIAAVFGNDPLRVQANIAGIREQLKQDLYADFFLLELVPEGSESAYPEDLLSQVKHLRVPASDASHGLFQKEALYNCGWRTALQQGSYEHFIFLDADIYCEQHDWFRRIRSRIAEEPRRAVQGWRNVRDTEDPDLLYSSVGAAFTFNLQTGLPLNPGMCWGVHRLVLEMGDGFNPYCVDCAGDSAFVAEYLNTPARQYDPWLYQWSWFQEIERSVPFHAELDCVPVDLLHVHHGPLKERNYDGFRYALEAFPPLQELVRLNGDGILEWRDQECPERRILEHRASMISRQAVDDLLDRMEYTRYSREVQPTVRARLTKRPIETPSVHRKLLPPSLRMPHGREQTEGIRIFDPSEVFRRDFPFSWCDGVVNLEGSTFAPIRVTDEFAALILEGKPETPYVVCALPLQPTWQAVDISSHHVLRFSIRVLGSPADVLVSLVSQDPNGSERESSPYVLKSTALEGGEWIGISIPLPHFAASVDLQRIRLVKFVGFASFQFQLARIHIGS